ncbi:MAG: pre-peptidase C-terminal domain-containing protein [Planctomycetia bacterium]|nr:pre-peptidase C-terminal domain-containing protein [Planctomycetia bacterium]
MGLSIFLELPSTPTPLLAQPEAPSYVECRLDSIFPNGGRRGTRVTVEFKGTGAGLTSPRDIVIDGAPGLTVKGIKSVNGNTLEAVLDIAADAPLGRRWLRVLNEHSGLTNFAYFVVGNLPEQIEIEPNPDTEKSQSVVMPTVINGRINPTADLDVFRFHGKAGQRFVAAIAAHALDVHGQSKNYGIADFDLALIDARGRTLAVADDVLGFDPLIEHTLPTDGDYFVRVQLLNYGGYPEAIYRLTLGETPYIVGAFPAGYRRGTKSEIELLGSNVPPNTKLSPPVSPATSGPLQFVTLQQAETSGLDVPLVVGDLPESLEVEPNDERSQSALVAWPSTINGRFQRSGDVDWYRVRLEAGRKITLEIYAQRFIRSPVDTLLQIYDASGKPLGENDDDVFEPGYESYHDFKTTDSKFTFTAVNAGEYFIKVTEQSGLNGLRAIYRLSIDEARPDFRLSHFPDAVPIWGPGSSACVLVRIDRSGGCDDDIELSVVDLPSGWSTKSAVSLGNKGTRPYDPYQLKVFLSLTAPADAAPGTCVPFRIVGRAKRSDGTAIERQSIPLTLFYSSDTGFFRASPTSRAAVAKSPGVWLETAVRELSIAQGESELIAVKVCGAQDLKTMPIVVNLASAGVACGLSTPQNIPVVKGMVEVPLKIAREMHPGTYGITIAQTWRSDIRIGMPGPCTPLIRLTVLPAK